MSLPNCWTYATGTYTATLNYTLTGSLTDKKCGGRVAHGAAPRRISDALDRSRFAFSFVWSSSAGRVPAAAQTDTATLNASINGTGAVVLSSAALNQLPGCRPGHSPQHSRVRRARSRSRQGAHIAQRRGDADRAAPTMICARASTRSRRRRSPGWPPEPDSVSGTLSAATAQDGRHAGPVPGVRTGTQTFFFRNLWSYPTGTYTLTMTSR